MEAKATKILLLTTAYKPLLGGSEIAIAAVTQRLPEVAFDLLTPRLKQVAAPVEQDGNVNIQRLGWGRPIDKWLFLWSGFWRARQLLRKNRYTAIHLWQASHAGGVAWLLSWLPSCPPIILTFQEGKLLARQRPLLRWLRRLIIRRVKVATAISNYLKTYLLTLRPKLPVELIPNGVDIEWFSRQDSYGDLTYLADQLGIKPGERVVIHTGRLVKKNGLENLIRALALVRASYAGVVKLLLAGGGQEQATLTKLVKTLDLEQSVIFAGQVGNHTMPKYLQLAQIFVRPSFSEGLGISFLEAMAAGVPVVGSAVGGIPDFLQDQITGLVCDPHSPADIAAKISELLQDESLRHRFSQAGKILVEQNYNWDKLAPRYGKLYAEIIHRHPGL